MIATTNLLTTKADKPMIISKEILYRQGSSLFSSAKYKEVVSKLIDVLIDVKKNSEFIRLSMGPSAFTKSAYNPNLDKLVCSIDSRYWDQIKSLYYFLETSDYALRFSSVNKEGNISTYTINIDRDNLFNWYYVDEFRQLRYKIIGSVIKNPTEKNIDFKNFAHKYMKPEQVESFKRYKSWDNKDVFGFMEPTKLSAFINFENPYLSGKISGAIAHQNKSAYQNVKIEDIEIQVIENNRIIQTLEFPKIYYNPRIEETRLNQYITEYIDTLSPEAAKSLTDAIYEYNKPITAFSDIETNVGAVEEGEMPWDTFNRVVSTLDNRKESDTVEVVDDTLSSASLLEDGNSDKGPKYGYSDKSDEELDEALEDDDNAFSSPSDPYQPINTISIAINNQIIVASRRKYLNANEIKICQDEIDAHFKGIKVYEDNPYKFSFLQFDTEYELIEFYLSHIVRRCAAVSGWNFFGYDWPYIINRYFRILRYWLAYNYAGREIASISAPVNINIDVQNRLKTILKFKKYDKITDSDLFEVIVECLIKPDGDDNLTGFIVKNIKTLSGRNLQLYMPNNRIIYDYLEIYAKWDRSVAIKESMTLDWTSQTLLKVPKLEHNLGFDEFYAKQFRTYVVYNAIDSILVSLLDKVIKTSDIYLSYATTMMIEPNYALSSVRPITNVISNFANKKNLIFPRVLTKKPRGDNDFAGAYVKAPVPGLYKSVIALDYASLYPSTIRSMAISPENLIYQGTKFQPSPEQMRTFVDDPYGAYNEYIPAEDVKAKYEEDYEKSVRPKDQIPREERVYTPSGAIFKKTENALLPSVLTHYYKERRDAKSHMKTAIHNLNLVERELLKRFPNTKYEIEF